MNMLAEIDPGAIGGLVVLLAILCVVIPVAIALFVFWIWMLISAVQSQGLTEGEKIAWVLVIVLVHWLGALLYFFIGHPKRKTPLAPPVKQ